MLYLNGNAFTGGLPAEWSAPAAWPCLQLLFLGDNLLSGEANFPAGHRLTSKLHLAMVLNLARQCFCTLVRAFVCVSRPFVCVSKPEIVDLVSTDLVRTISRHSRHAHDDLLKVQRGIYGCDDERLHDANLPVPL